MFTAAAIFLATQGEMDLLTLPAVLCCAVGAVIALTGNQLWALVIGVGLVSVSLALQISMNYWCNSCMKADMLILAAVVSLAVIQRGRLKIPVWALTGIISILLLGATAIAGPEPLIAAATTVKTGLSEETAALAKQKPVLLFNPNCAPCGEVVSALIEIDPAADNWLAVQSGGQQGEGLRYLEEKGYQGAGVIYQKQSQAVPALVIERNGVAKVIRGKEEIVRIIAERG